MWHNEFRNHTGSIAPHGLSRCPPAPLWDVRYRTDLNRHDPASQFDVNDPPTPDRNRSAGLDRLRDRTATPLAAREHRAIAASRPVPEDRNLHPIHPSVTRRRATRPPCGRLRCGQDGRWRRAMRHHLGAHHHPAARASQSRATAGRRPEAPRGPEPRPRQRPARSALERPPPSNSPQARTRAPSRRRPPHYSAS